MPVSDRIVTAKMVLQAQIELQRLGIHKTVVTLEATEPDLAEYLLEGSTALYHQILRTGASNKQARQIHEGMQRLTLVCLRSLQLAHAELWQESVANPPIPPRRLNSPDSNN